MNRLLDVAIYGLQVAIVAGILTLIALVAVDAYIKDEDNRVANLKRHFWDLAYSRVEGPAAPTGVRQNYGELSEPKTRVFADTSVKSEVLTRQNERRRDGVK